MNMEGSCHQRHRGSRTASKCVDKSDQLAERLQGEGSLLGRVRGRLRTIRICPLMWDLQASAVGKADDDVVLQVVEDVEQSALERVVPTSHRHLLSTTRMAAVLSM